MPNIVKEKSFAFAVSIVVMCDKLKQEAREYVLSRQLMRSGTAIGALVTEAEQAESRADFIHKMSVALKEANETLYWLRLLHKTNYLQTSAFANLDREAEDLFRLLTKIIKSTKRGPAIDS